MRNAILVSILTVVLVVGAAAVYAGPPIAGTYKSTNGDFDEGAATTSWAPGGFLGASGNVIYARSSSGGVFTNDWTLGCALVQSAVLIVPKFGPNGQEIWQITYAPGAIVTLGGPGNPWSGGDAVYNGVVDTYTEIRTVQYVNNAVVGAVSDHAVGAHLLGYTDSCVAWAIGNGVLRGGTPGGTPAFTYPTLQSVKSAAYPDFPSLAGCTFSVNGVGHWDDIRDLTLSITGCAVATEPSTWGNVKAMYRN